jgi:glycosyltransferase involved in cell wall biosynthesis
VAYDGYAFTCSDGGAGKGAQLRNLLDGFGSAFTGFAPETRNNARMKIEEMGVRLVQRGRSNYLLWQQTHLPRLLAEMRPDIFLAPYNTAPLRIPSGTKLITVIHDLILLEDLPDRTLPQWIRDKYRAMLVRKAIRRSSLIVTVSNFTAEHITRHFSHVRSRVIPCTVSSSWFVGKNVVSPLEREGYILLVTSLAAHKNLPRAMEAFARFRSLDPKSVVRLRIAGVSYARQAIGVLMQKLGLPSESVIIEPFLSERELQLAYEKALCVILPSLMEGFGIPALEAMASGTPLLCSSAWSLPEVGGDAPLYFDPTDVEEMAHGLLRICAGRDLRLQMSERGIVRAEAFHPDRIRIQVEDFWRELPILCESGKIYSPQPVGS